VSLRLHGRAYRASVARGRAHVDHDLVEREAALTRAPERTASWVTSVPTPPAAPLAMTVSPVSRLTDESMATAVVATTGSDHATPVEGVKLAHDMVGGECDQPGWALRKSDSR